MNKQEIKIKNAKRIVRLLRDVKTSNIHDRNLAISILNNCIYFVENKIKNNPPALTRLEQLDRAIDRGEKFLRGVALVGIGTLRKLPKERKR